MKFKKKINFYLCHFMRRKNNSKNYDFISLHFGDFAVENKNKIKIALVIILSNSFDVKIWLLAVK